ncbi:polyprenyl synthetase family protein [Hippea maritima]|uniref:Polyprenyl synthetase n=1 Tax=Hippea maritima (strain ATCC 700847 / DSM 10411 / MH2) TaxID=760142 RepID=F2LWE4_HIPMA|nr:polyprenyl synthetase family protein [Hippea maritima]AEA32990.1 Polyprenyl synthetase [Hippea maritima DSM 10411]
MNIKLKLAIKKDIKAVNEALAVLIKPESNLTRKVYEQVIGDGKRLRPLLVLYSASALGIDEPKDALVVGSAVELIHTASLLHDDIIDDALYRRGKPASHTVYGIKPAVMGGDYLYSLAYNIVLDYDVDVAKAISRAAYILSEGEIEEIEQAFKVNIGFDDYYRVIYKKTAVLIEASCESGAILANKQFSPVFKEYGKNLGLAFQIKDDCLDYQADPEVLGKDVGIDLKEGKITLPVLYAMDEDPLLKEKIADFFDKKDESVLADIVLSVKEKGLNKALDKAKEFSVKAKETLKGLKDSTYKGYLEAIADYAIEREK